MLDIMVDLARDGAGAGFPGRDHSLIENDDLRQHAAVLPGRVKAVSSRRQLPGALEEAMISTPPLLCMGLFFSFCIELA
ncbi:hypothetical protein [Bradyrhizobium nitroreducens]|uniref:hypothetical protein n=1 Tax=Bradyrhizobium nitroreducens TaxID=709803 RepID=UPI003D30F0FF